MPVDRVNEEREKLACFCAECGGRCCRSHQIILSSDEYIRLKEIKDFPEGCIDSSTGCRIKTIDASGGCPFLGKEGCVLKEEKRPLVCRLYPLTAVMEGRRFVYYLSSLCPCHEGVKSLNEWLQHSILLAEKELRLWDRKESSFLGKRTRREGEELIEVDI